MREKLSLKPKKNRVTFSKRTKLVTAKQLLKLLIKDNVSYMDYQEEVEIFLDDENIRPKLIKLLTIIENNS
jgi:hypothetical protein